MFWLIGCAAHSYQATGFVAIAKNRFFSLFGGFGAGTGCLTGMNLAQEMCSYAKYIILQIPWKYYFFDFLKFSGRTSGSGAKTGKPDLGRFRSNHIMLYIKRTGFARGSILYSYNISLKPLVFLP